MIGLNLLVLLGSVNVTKNYLNESLATNFLIEFDKVKASYQRIFVLD